MGQPLAEAFPIFHRESVGEVRRAVKALAANLGFESVACEEAVLAAVELSTNLIKHAGGGKLTLEPLSAGGRLGLQIESVDQGPGIADVQQALADRFSTAQSRGVGLGAVNRLMDELEISSERGYGTHIVCRKWVRDHATSLGPCPLECGAATRPRVSNEPNGDAFVIKQWGECLLVAVIDGLGHGQHAHRASQAAKSYIESHFDLPLAKIFSGVERACRATRGVVMAIALFDWGNDRLFFGSVGNIEIRVFPKRKLNLAIRRGVIGHNAPNPVVAEHAWTAEDVMVLHSDGLGTRWDRNDFPDLTGKPVTAAAQELLLKLARDHDDSTVVVVRNKIA